MIDSVYWCAPETEFAMATNDEPVYQQPPPPPWPAALCHCGEPDSDELLDCSDDDCGSTSPQVVDYGYENRKQLAMVGTALRRERNRLSARRCRAKRRLAIVQMQEELVGSRREVGELRRKNRDLENQVRIVMNEAERLRCELADALVSLGRVKQSNEKLHASYLSSMFAVAEVEAHFP